MSEMILKSFGIVRPGSLFCTMVVGVAISGASPPATCDVTASTLPALASFHIFLTMSSVLDESYGSPLGLGLSEVAIGKTASPLSCGVVKFDLAFRGDLVGSQRRILPTSPTSEFLFLVPVERLIEYLHTLLRFYPQGCYVF